MSVINYVTLRLEPPFGFNAAEPYIVSIMPLLALFNGTVVLYTIPIAYTIIAAIRKITNLKLD